MMVSRREAVECERNNNTEQKFIQHKGSKLSYVKHFFSTLFLSEILTNKSCIESISAIYTLGDTTILFRSSCYISKLFCIFLFMD